MSNLSSLTLGTMIKLWHDSRGHDYVFVGVNTKTKKALFLKANCINQSGHVRSNTTGIHKVLDVTPTGAFNNVKRVTRVLGTKPLDSDKIEKFLKTLDEAENIVVAKKRKSVYTCLPQVDSRDAITYLT